MRIDARILALLALFYRKVDEEIERLAEVHADKLVCSRGCSTCCVDNISVFTVEAGNILHHHEDLLVTAEPHAAGACAFLDEAGACRIYHQRPYVCRTQGLPFRWIEDNDMNERIEWRDICPVNAKHIAVMELPEEGCLTLGSFEGQLADLQKTVFGNLDRVLMRSLFAKA
jgi:Fe-S-cluster containining protein